MWEQKEIDSPFFQIFLHYFGTNLKEFPKISRSKKVETCAIVGVLTKNVTFYLDRL